MAEELIRRLRDNNSLGEEMKECDIVIKHYTSRCNRSIKKRDILDEKFQELIQTFKTLNAEISEINLTHHTKRTQLQLRYTMDVSESIKKYGEEIMMLSRKVRGAKQVIDIVKTLREIIVNIDGEYQQHMKLLQDGIREKQELQIEKVGLQRECAELKRY